MSFLGEPPTAASAPAASAPPAAPAAVASSFWQPWSVDSEPSKKKRKDTEGEPEGEPEDQPQNIEPEPEKRKVKCPHCSLFLSSRGSLHNHIKVKHSHAPKHVCDQCGQGFTRKDYLQRHLSTHVDSEPSKKKRKDTEGEPEGEPEPSRKVKCPHCSFLLQSSYLGCRW